MTDWYLDAIIYEVHVKAFLDSDGDGAGDFRGLTQRLDYLQDLGVTAIWLLPFYPSPLRDDGYDIADYRRVNPTYGTMRDFRDFVRAAHDHGLRVITELVINHTSDQHRWFQRARQAKPGSAWRNYYVWSNTDKKYQGTRIIFLDTETSNWAWDPEAQAYYWHRFYAHQPDLNYNNPQVLKEMLRVMHHWLDMGVDGMRLDAIPYLCVREGTNNENLPETHEILRKIRADLDANYEGRMFLGEANQWPEDVRPYFGNGDECHMAYHFPLMPRIYMALAQEDRHPITDIMRQTPDIPEGCQWAIFLRNHDELTLEMVTDRERDYLWRYYAGDPRARLNLGIRRRLAPLLENDRRKIELLNSLLMSMPGTPIIYYGDEIGMGDNVFLGDRDGVRTPMQWSPDRNGGFSRADPAQLYLPPIMDPVFGYEAVNVEAQSRSPSSLLNWMKRLIAARKANQAFGRGTLTFLFPGNRKIVAYLRKWESEVVLCVANLSSAVQPVELDLSIHKERIPVELLSRTVFPPIGELPYFITLPAYGFYWFVLTDEVEAPSWHEIQATPLPELETLVLPQGWSSLMASGARKTLEGQIVPKYLETRRWFAGKDEKLTRVTLSAFATVPAERNGAMFLTSSVSFKERAQDQLYSLPLAITWEDAPDETLAGLRSFTLAQVRQGSRLGILHDAMNDDGFVRGLVKAMGENLELPANDGGNLEYESMPAFPNDLDLETLPIVRAAHEQSNTSVQFGDRMVLKLYRRLWPGVHPEIEIGRHLGETAEFRNTPALLGSLCHVKEDGTPLPLAVLMEYISNQGDAWSFTLNYLKKFFEEANLVVSGGAGEADDHHAAFLVLMRTLGRRIGELHQALAAPTKSRAFSPVAIKSSDLVKWRSQVSKQSSAAFAALRRVQRSLEGESRDLARALLKARAAVTAYIRASTPDAVAATKTRFHGDLHLGQVLVKQDDFVLIDFEGEPAHPLTQRRMKHSPLRDVAGMLRSFDYAASVALKDYTTIRPDSLTLLAPLAEDWRRRAKAVFLEGYRDAAAGSSALPDDDEVVAKLINLFMIEKTMYEICYEAANRPDWLQVPVGGALELIGASP